MTHEQLQLLNELIDTVDQSNGKLLMGLDPKGQLIYVDRANPEVHEVDSQGRFKRTTRYQIRDHSLIKTAFGYETERRRFRH